MQVEAFYIVGWIEGSVLTGPSVRTLHSTNSSKLPRPDYVAEFDIVLFHESGINNKNINTDNNTLDGFDHWIELYTKMEFNCI